VAAKLLRAALVAKAFLGFLPPVAFLAVCLVRAILCFLLFAGRRSEEKKELVTDG